MVVVGSFNICIQSAYDSGKNSLQSCKRYEDVVTRELANFVKVSHNNAVLRKLKDPSFDFCPYNFSLSYYLQYNIL